MENTRLHIKHMVCKRCIKVVKDELEKLGLSVIDIELGKVELAQTLSTEKKEEIRICLDENGFELIDDKKSQLIDRIKTTIIEKIHYQSSSPTNINFSDFLAHTLDYEYSYLSHLFSSMEGITIEKYIILQKVEKIKELLVYNELSLKEIAFQMDYSSVQHLSNQFKKTTGLTPTEFKNLKKHNRKPLDEV